ncbi:MAG: aldo/keto reductase [Chloroflexota bacterium]
MKYRTLGRTKLQVSALALGTVELGMDYGIEVDGNYGKPSTNDAIRLVHAALDRGINFIDTARAYGESEAVLGQALQGKRDQVVLATKVVTHNTDGAVLTGATLQQQMWASLETSLKMLQTDYVDLWQIHNVDAALLKQQDSIRTVFEQAQQKGYVRAVGGSTYGVSAPQQAIEQDLFDTLQVTYSVLDQRLADHVFDLAKTKNIGIIVRSVLLQGVLTERADHLPDHLSLLKERSRQFRKLVLDATPNLKPAQLAIAFGLAHPDIASVLVGVRTEAELREDIQALQAELPDELLAQLYQLRLDDDALLNPGTWHDTVS